MTLITEWFDERIKNKHINYFEYSEFSKIDEIGRGGFGKVSKAELANTGLVALKSFVDIEEGELKRLDDEFIKELELLREIDCHENVNRILGITEVYGRYNLVLEYANEGNLRNYLEKNFTLLDWKDKIQMALDITCGLKFLHFKEIIHRDLHSKNILVNNGKLLVADFGLSKKIEEASTNSIANTRGIIEYTEPQCLMLAKYKKNKKSDIYSLGVLLWEISSGHPPFHLHYDKKSLCYLILFSNIRERPIDGTPQEYQQLYQKCWDVEPNLRPDIEKVYETLSQLKTEDSPYPQLSRPNIEINSNFNYNDDLSISDSIPQAYQQLYQKCWDVEPNSRLNIGKVYETLSQLKTEDSPYPQLSQSNIEINSNFNYNDDLSISDSLNSSNTALPAYSHSIVEAIWDFIGDDAEDLSFKKGDIVEVVEYVNMDWWRGRIQGISKVGMFPKIYTKVLSIDKNPFVGSISHDGQPMDSEL